LGKVKIKELVVAENMVIIKEVKIITPEHLTIGFKVFNINLPS